MYSIIIFIMACMYSGEKNDMTVQWWVVNDKQYLRQISGIGLCFCSGRIGSCQPDICRMKCRFMSHASFSGEDWWCKHAVFHITSSLHVNDPFSLITGYSVFLYVPARLMEWLLGVLGWKTPILIDALLQNPVAQMSKQVSSATLADVAYRRIGSITTHRLQQPYI